MPSPKGTEDYFKVQNVTTLRDTDVADTNNLSVPERQAILGASTFKGLFLNVLTSLPAAGDFNTELNAAPWSAARWPRRKTRMVRSPGLK